jgi:hypothetical protein
MITSLKHYLLNTHKGISYGEAQLVSANLYTIDSRRKDRLLRKDRIKVHNDETFV